MRNRLIGFGCFLIAACTLTACHYLPVDPWDPGDPGDPPGGWEPPRDTVQPPPLDTNFFPFPPGDTTWDDGGGRGGGNGDGWGGGGNGGGGGTWGDGGEDDGGDGGGGNGGGGNGGGPGNGGGIRNPVGG